MPAAGVILRGAAPGDVATIHALVSELAAYEKLSHAVQSTAAMLGDALFCAVPRVFCELAEVDGAPAGLAVWFYDFSTFRGRQGIFLEDLFVRPDFRGRGIGRSLIARLAARCVTEHLPRMTWAVLDWNQPAVAFYQAQGAVLLDEWTGCSLTGDALLRLGTTTS